MPQIPQLGQSKVVGMLRPSGGNAKPGAQFDRAPGAIRRALLVILTCFVVVSLVLAGPATAEIPLQSATLGDGQKIEGHLALGPASAGWQFVVEGNRAIPLALVRQVDFPNEGWPFDDYAHWTRINLWGGQVALAGEITCQADEASLRGGFFGARKQTLPVGVLAGVELDASIRGDASAGPTASNLTLHRQIETDTAVLSSGDALFGRFEGLDSLGAAFQFPFGPQRLSREKLLGLQFARRPTPRCELTGWHVAVDFVFGVPRKVIDPATGKVVGIGAPLDDGQGPLIHGVLQEIGRNGLTIEHPCLGPLTVPWDLARRVTPLFQGRRIELAATAFHLGNQLMADFEVQEPQSDLELKFDLGAVPMGQVWLVIEAEELESSHSARFARQLAAGHLRTNLTLNDKLLEALNDWVEQTDQRRQRLRVPVPAGLLTPAGNVLHISQTGQPDDPHELDDCGLARFALEVQAAP